LFLVLLVLLSMFMTIPFFERHKRGMKPLGLSTFDILVFEEQAHYKVRGGECVQRNAAPHVYVYRTLFQAQMNVGLEPRNLIFGETDYSFFSERPVPACFLKSVFEGMLCRKSFIRSAVELTFINHSW
jgi:hypothetical protein